MTPPSISWPCRRAEYGVRQDDPNSPQGHDVTDPKRRLPVARPAQGECVAVDYGRDDRGFPVEALVVRDGERVRAYLHICKHIAIPLDAGTGEFLDEEEHRVCVTHGALYRVSDGRCIAGP